MRLRLNTVLAVPALLALCSALLALRGSPASDQAVGKDPRELPVRRVGDFASAAEAYFSRDGKQLIVTARMPDHENHNVYILNTDGTNVRRITNKGKDACTFFAPDGKHIVFSSDRDADQLPPGDYANSANYPAGSEVYIANADGTGIRRLTFNTAYEAETSFSPNGKWILYTSNIDGNLELYRMTTNGKKNTRITHTSEMQEGGAFYMPDGKHVIYRAWKKGDEANKNRISQLYMIRDDGTGLTPLTDSQEFNWSPYPSPDGKHVVFAHKGTGDFEIYLLNIETRKTTRLTYHPKFDSYAVISPDGKTLEFTSSRDGAPAIYLMDLTPILNDAGSMTGTGLAESKPAPGQSAPASLAVPGEKHLANIRQLTFGGENAEAYLSADGKQLILQSTRDGKGCDAQYIMKADGSEIRMVSSGKGRTTCGYFFPNGRRIIYASTHLGGETCPPPPDFSKGYVWALYPSFDIFSADPDGSKVKRLTDNPGYDAEGTISPDGKYIIFTSYRDGDLDLYRMDANGKRVKRLTTELGYDGGAFYSLDGKKIVYRASRPKTDEELKAYKELLEVGMIRPSALELFVMDADGKNKRQITSNGAANFAPFMLPNNRQIIFSSNMDDPKGRNFDLYLVNADGTGLERVTFNETFDGFPMFTRDGKKLVFASNRNAQKRGDTNIFIADWMP
ncbi:MAG: PD40 domain-containing protein [Acidobacteria bacterium]|nr:PD40 domain-containing protein [Acidobacteriota bacterium]